MAGFTHFDDDGKAVMVDVSGKDVTLRTATAAASVYMEPATLRLIQDRQVPPIRLTLTTSPSRSALHDSKPSQATLMRLLNSNSG